MHAILTYHSIDESGSVISTTLEKFRTQMHYLARSHIKVISLQEMAARMRDKNTEPAVSITFDDGFRNFREKAFPVLLEFGFPATVFLVTGFCGRNNRWIGQPPQIPILDLLSWDEILELSAQGIEMGAHTVTHPNLAGLDAVQAIEEIVRSKAMIQERLGKQVSFFAYPYGVQTVETSKTVDAEYDGACSADMGFAVPQSDVHFLPRIDMYYFSRNDFFFWIDTPKFIRYVQYRSLLRSCKRVYRRLV